MELWTEEDKQEAQAALNLYPDNSTFWDTDSGQEVLECARHFGIDATNTNRERCRLHAELMSQYA